MALAGEELARRHVPLRECLLKKPIKENKTKMKGNLDAAFNYFADLLNLSCQQAWETICACECDTAGYTDCNGRLVEGAVRGRSFDSLRDSLCMWLLSSARPTQPRFRQTT